MLDFEALTFNVGSQRPMNIFADILNKGHSLYVIAL